MFFYKSDIDQSLISEFQLDSRKGRLQFLKELAEDLLNFPQDYRLFGPYWWYVKEQIRREGIARRGWFHNSPGDREIVEQLHPLGPEYALAASLQYLRLMQEEPNPPTDWELERNIWETGKECELLPVQDNGLHSQGDLFAEIEQSETERREFLNMPDNYIPRIWKEKGNLRLEEGKPFHAMRCYMRYLSTSSDNSSRADAWLLMGLAFQNIGHYPKAIFAFSNAYDRDTQDWILAHLAEAQVEGGNLRDGLSLYENLVRAVPGNPEYLQRLEALRRQADQPVELEELNELPFHAFKRSLG